MTTLECLRFCAGSLALARGTPIYLARPRPDDWESILRIAAAQRVMPALADAAKAVHADRDLRAELACVAETNLHRNRAALRELESVLLCCNSIGIEPVLLKGAARIATSPEALTSRQLGDIDILVPPGRVREVAGALREAGYYSVPFNATDDESLKHYPRLIHPRRRSPVEVHRALGELPWQDVLPAGEALSSAPPFQFGRARCRLLSPTHSVVHAIIHSQLDNRGHWSGALSLRALDDCASAGLIDWDEVQEAFARHKLTAVAIGCRRALHWLFESSGSLSSPPRPIRRLVDVTERNAVFHLGRAAGWARWYAAQFSRGPAARRAILDRLGDSARWKRLPSRVGSWVSALLHTTWDWQTRFRDGPTGAPSPTDGPGLAATLGLRALERERRRTRDCCAGVMRHK